MNIADLTDTDVIFSCDIADDKCKYWDYNFYARVNDYEYMRSMSKNEVKQLKDNCIKILKSLETLS